MKNHNLLFVLISAVITVSACKETKGTKEFVSVGKIITIDSSLSEIIDSTSPIEVLADGFQWSEGPLWLENEKMLIFSDVPENVIYSWSESDGVKTYLTPAGNTSGEKSKEGSNGLMLDQNGNLIICQHGDRAVARMESPVNQPKADFKVLVQKYSDKLLNSPNDICLARNGDMFFTDPPYGLKGLDDSKDKELDFNGVYRLTSKGDLLLIEAQLTKPNGIALSSDEKFLYVANSDPDKAIWMKYLLDDYLNVTGKEVFADKTSDVPNLKGLPDGLKVNRSGIIFASGPGGILIFHPDGRHLGTIMTGEATSNCALDTDEKYLYMTADDYLMRVKLK
ncbi:MAG: SMP-30/gluconolactonase/LRE family protein [Saprospiraceae bacterium]|nr:SMP-30/gluconolactonase/LRE family protein [Saprospiraceae bacterium]